MAARGETIVMLCGDKWHDLFYLKSEDGGETWEKTVVWEHPYPFFDFDVTVTDTFWACDGHQDVAIGPDGKVHVIFSIGLYLHDDPGSGQYQYYYGLGVDGVVYWNEDMEPFGNDIKTLAPPWYEEPESELNDDPELGVVNLIGYTLDYNGNETLDFTNDNIFSYRGWGLSTTPNIIVDDNNDVYTVWASVTETFDNGTYNYRKIWTRAYANGAWGPFFHVTESIIHIIDETIWPVLSETSDDNLHIIYQADGTPGSALDDDHGYQENRYIHAALPKSDLLTGIGDSRTMDDSFVSQNYPNPVNDYTTVTVTLEESATLGIKVMNQLGQVVYENNRGTVTAGNHFFQIDATGLTSGVYFYTVTSGTQSVTRKMIVN
jgi:hypothetical protein